MKRNKIKKKMLIVLIAIIILITISIFLVLKIKNSKNTFLGSWVSEGGTIYEFKSKNVGTMKTSLSEYIFIYQIKDDVLSIDFDDEKVNDIDYNYSFENNKCILKSNRGTFVFTKEK